MRSQRPHARVAALMRVFLDFEASSLADDSYPIEVGWVFEDGREEHYLIFPADGWMDWSAAAEGVHGISRATIEREGTPHREVATRMMNALSDHDLLASAPSWDGKWLSVLLRAAGLPRHALRLRSTKAALEEEAIRLLSNVVPPEQLSTCASSLVAQVTSAPQAPAHRALADARQERERWIALQQAAARLSRETAAGR